MKIAIVSNTAWNILNFRVGLILFLQSKGYEVVYIAPYDDSVEKIKLFTSAKFLPLRYLQRKGYNPFSDFLLTKELANYYQKEKIDIAISYTIKPNIYSSFAGIFTRTKTIANITGLGYVFLKSNIANFIAKSILRISLRFNSIIVFQNISDKKLFIEQKMCSVSKSRLINGSGINTSHYIPSSNNLEKNQFTFLFIGRLLYDKGIREFIFAANKLNEEFSTMKFQCLGSLDQEGNPSAVSSEQMDSWLAENESLEYINHQSDVRPYILNCNAIVLPSYREGIPRVLLEAMALEKPFITVKSPGCEDVTINTKNGLLAEVASKDSLFQKMKELFLLGHDKQLAMGKFGRQLVIEKYDEKIIVEEYLKLILNL